MASRPAARKTTGNHPLSELWSLQAALSTRSAARVLIALRRGCSRSPAMLDLEGAAAEAAAVFAMLAAPERSWAHEFVLGGWDGDPAGDCAALCNSLALRCGETNECMAYMPGARERATHRVSAPDDHHADYFAWFHNSSVWVPSWTHDGVTVGMAVHTSNPNPVAEEHERNDESSNPELCIGRFARDERSGEMLLVLKEARQSQLRGRQKVIVKHTRYIDAHNAEVMWLVSDYDVMRGLQNSEPVTKFTAALIYRNVTKAVRASPVCGLTQSTAARCDCQVARSIPISPTDYSRFRANGTYGLGRWAGASTVHYVGRRRGFLSGPRNASTIFSMTAYPDAVRTRLGGRLQSLAIQERMISGAFCKPFPLPADNVEPPQPVTAADAEKLAVDATSLPPLASNFQDVPEVDGSVLDDVISSAEVVPVATTNVSTDEEGRGAEWHAGDTKFSSPAAVCGASGPAVARTPAVATGLWPPTSLADEQLAKKRRRQESSRLAAARSKARQKEYTKKLTQDLASAQARLLEVQKRHASALAVNSALTEVVRERGSSS